MRCLRSLPSILTVLFLCTGLIAQNPAVLPRIAGPVNDKSMVVLGGNVPTAARAEFDQGPALASTQLSNVRLVLARSSEQQAALDKFDVDLLDQSSPNYHQWLTPEQFGKLYGPADSDIAAIVAWLESNGVRVNPIAPGRTTIDFSGTVQQIEDMLHVSIHSFEINGEQFFANIDNPSIPAALAPVVSGVGHLNTIRPKPQHVAGQMGLFDKSSGKLQAVAQTSLRGPHAELTSPSNNSLYLVPGDAATIYNTPNSVLNANFASGASYSGTGVTIGIGGDSTVTAGIVGGYRTAFLGEASPTLPAVSYCGQQTAPPPAAQPTCSGSSLGLGIGTGDKDEAYLDMEIAGGLAPGAAIHYYASADLGGAIQAAINQNTVDIFSLSFGACELDLTTADNQTINGWWQQAATQGIAVTVSTGDDGSAACDQNPQSGSGIATGGLRVSGFASTPYNIAVGGTDFGPLLSAFGTYVNPSSSNATASLYRTAKSYIPEWTWNDSTTVNTTLSQNKPYHDPSTAATNIVAGSGGKSTCINNTTQWNLVSGTWVETRGTCNAGYAKPTWQRGTGVPSDSARDIPDISLMAGAGGDAAAWLVCTDYSGPNSSGVTVTADCTNQTDGHFYFFGFGGTSTSAPAFAGILALVQQGYGKGRLGQAAKNLYDLYNGSNASAIFHDVTIGNISVPCQTGTPDCSTNAAGNLFLTGYDTTAGYDLATGIGSVDATQLIKYWGSATGGEATTVTLAPANTTIARTSATAVDITVKGSASTGNPTGSVTLSSGSYSPAGQTLTASGADSGTAHFDIPANSLAKGTDTLTASYAGDTNYASQTGAATITVTGSAATVTVVPSTVNLNSGAALNVTTTVTGPAGAGTPSGTITLTGSGYTSTATALNAAGKATITIPAFTFNTAGPVTITASYSGDTGFDTATGTANVTVTKSTFTLSATDVTLTAGATTGNVSAITVTPAAGYTGTITLTAAVTSAPSGAVNLPTLVGSTVAVTDANPQEGTVTVGTAAATAARTGTSGTAWFRAAGGTALAAFLIFCAPLGFRRGRRILGLVLVLTAATFTAVGCGGGGGTPQNPQTSQKTTPTVTVTPTPTTVTTGTAVSVAISVSGGTQTPTGTVTLSGGGYSGTATTLANGAATISIPGTALSVGTDTLTATYSGDTNFNGATGTATVTVNAKPTPTVAVTASKTTFSSDTPISVGISVTGTGQTPTGSVTLTGGGFSSTATTLSNGTATINIPGNALSVGTDTLTVSYGGDSNFGTATGTLIVTVNPPKTTAGVYTITVTGTGNDAAHTTATSTFTLTVN